MKEGGGFYTAGDDDADDDDDDDEEEEPQGTDAGAGASGASSASAEAIAAGSSTGDGWDAVARKGFLLDTKKAGDGCTFPSPGDWVTVSFTGCTQRSRKDFSSGGHMSFLLDGRTVSKGIESGLRQMALGETAELRVAASCASGGSDSRIPKGEDMALQVELVGLEKPPSARQIGAFSAAERKEIVQQFYAKHDPTKPEADIDMVLSKKQYVADFGKLCKGLEKKYNEHPATLWWSAKRGGGSTGAAGAGTPASAATAAAALPSVREFQCSQLYCGIVLIEATVGCLAMVGHAREYVPTKRALGKDHQQQSRARFV